MANAKIVTGNFGASTSPISFAPEIKSNKERLLKKFREQLGQKGYSPAEASTMATKVRADANALAVEVNAREGNDDRVRMANIHTMALKMKIADALRAVPKKAMAGDEMMGRLSKTSPMSVSVADRGKTYNANIVNKRAKARDKKREAVVYDWEKMRKKHGKLKDSILNEALRASYMQQFNGSLGYYHGGMGWKALKKFAQKAQTAVKKVAAPIQKVAAPIKKVAAVVSKPVVQAVKYTGKSIDKAAAQIKKDPVAFLTKVAIAPVSLAASAFPAHTVLGKGARKIEAGAIKFVKAAVTLVQKVLKFIWDKVIKGAWEFIKKAFKQVAEWFSDLVGLVKEKVWNKFHGKSGVSGMGELGADAKAEEMKNIEKSVAKTVNRLKAKGEGDFESGLKTYALKDFAAGKGFAAGSTAVESTIGVDALTTILSAGTGSAAMVGKAVVTYTAAAAPVSARVTAEASKEIGTKVVNNLKDIAFDEACKDYGSDLASRKIKNPIAQAITTEAIKGDLKGTMANVQAVSVGITDPSKRQAFVAAAAKLPEEKRVELIKQVAIPADFKPMVKNLDKQTEIIAKKVDVTKDTSKDVTDFANKLGPKSVPPLPPQAVAAIRVEGKIVQDKVAIEQVKKGELDKTQGILAMSSIGQKAVVNSLPPQQRAVVIEEIKESQPSVVQEAKEIKEKKSNTTALVAAAAIAAKVLLF